MTHSAAEPRQSHRADRAVGRLAQQADSAVVIVTDEGLVGPSLVAARAARRYAGADAADVVIVSHSISESLSDALDRLAARDGVRHLTIDGAPWMGFDQERFARTHVPPSALARFFLPPSLLSSYGRVVYLDGDTLAVQDLRPLIRMPLDRGWIAAAEDVGYFFSRELGRTGARLRRYFEYLDLDKNQGYFNSGVLVSDTETWRDVSAEAFGFFRSNVDHCLYHDQSALNAVAGRRRHRLSPNWNYQRHYFTWDAPRSLDPRIVHFAGGQKPWLFAADPLRSFSPIYSEAKEELAAFGVPFRQLSCDEQRARGLAAAQEVRRMQRSPLRLRARRARLLRLHRQAAA